MDETEILSISAALWSLRQANKDRRGFVRMAYVKQEDVYHFEEIKPSDWLRLPQEERERLKKARPLVRKVITRFQHELGAYARARGMERSLFDQYFSRSRPTFRSQGEQHLRRKPAPTSEHRYFETFDDGRSVWTFSSNWKRPEDKI